MLSKSICIAAVILVLGVASPVFAASDMMDCSDASMSKMNTDMMKMKDGDHKTMAMKEMDMAKDMMMKKDMKGCMEHMTKASKAMGNM